MVANAVLGQAAGISQWPAQNIVIAPMTIATGAAAIFVNSRWVQGLALAIQIGGWIWYFAALQSSVIGMIIGGVGKTLAARETRLIDTHFSAAV